MALRFQKSDDGEIDRAAKEERATPLLIILLVLFAAIQGGFTWFRGESLTSYAKDLAWWIGFGTAYWMFSPFYYELRIRAKEIDGKVSAIEEAVAALKGDRAELLERLSAIEGKLDLIRED
jgi:hypothetical protein